MNNGLIMRYSIYLIIKLLIYLYSNCFFLVVEFILKLLVFRLIGKNMIYSYYLKKLNFFIIKSMKVELKYRL